MGNTCTPVADSFQYLAKLKQYLTNNTIQFYINAIYKYIFAIHIDYTQCYRLNVCVSFNSCVEILTSKIMYQKWNLWEMISHYPHEWDQYFDKNDSRMISLILMTSSEDTMKKQKTAICNPDKKFPQELHHTSPFISGILPPGLTLLFIMHLIQVCGVL